MFRSCPSLDLVISLILIHLDFTKKTWQQIVKIVKIPLPENVLKTNIVYTVSVSVFQRKCKDD